MLRLTYTISLALLLLGFLGFFGWEIVGAAKQSPTALAPAATASLMIICALFTKMSRPIGLVGAVVVALLGVAGSFVPLIKRGFDFGDAAVRLSGAAALLCAYYVIRAVAAYLAHRKAQAAAEEA